MLRYECDQCGACCACLIVQAEELDAVREPRLIVADHYWAGKSLLEVLDDLERTGRVVTLACGRPPLPRA